MDPSRASRAIAWSSIIMSGLFMVALVAVHYTSGSVLALSQAADSFVDLFVSAALLYSLHVGAQPADWNHPLGHQRAEPIAALIAAVLAGVLAFEVVRTAIEALITATRPQMHWTVAAAFSAKLVGKLGLFRVATHWGRRVGSQALGALAVDARNDVLVASLALVGFFAARYGAPGWDAWLAIPIGLWIGTAGLRLALDNIRLLMGEAPPVSRQRELQAIVESIPEVRASHEWKVRYDGPGLGVSVSVVLDEQLSLREAHDLAVEVERRLLAEADVLHASVHIDVDFPGGAEESAGR